MITYEVAVGNVGIVYSGNKQVDARAAYSAYVRESKAGRGRAAHEGVSLFRDGELVLDYTPPTPEEMIAQWLSKNPAKSQAIARAALCGLHVGEDGRLNSADSDFPSGSDYVAYVTDCADAHGFDKLLEKIRSTQIE